MKKYEEMVNVVRCVGGYRLVSANPARYELLLKLFCGHASEVGKLIRMPLGGLLDNVRSVAVQEKMGVRIEGDPKMPSLILWDLAKAEAAAAVPLKSELKALRIPLAATWQPDGRIMFPNTLPGMFETRFDWDPSLSRKANKQAAARHVASLFPDVATTYFSLADLLDKKGNETPYQFGHGLYRYTACGPWVSFVVPGEERGRVYYGDKKAGEVDWLDRCTGIEIGSIVEGSDVEVGPECLDFPFTKQELDGAVKRIDDEAKFYWERDNSTYYSVRKADGEVEMWCQWESFDDKPSGSFDEDDAEEVALATRAYEVLMEVGSPDYETLIPIPGTEFFVREEPVPDITY